jgi:hypothetical protein
MMIQACSYSIKRLRQEDLEFKASQETLSQKKKMQSSYKLYGIHIVSLSLSLFLTGFLYIAQAGFELAILLLLPPEFWNYSYAPPCPESHRFF